MTNKEKLQAYVKNQKRPVIVYNVETTGIMDGNDNRITQIALAAYNYNHGNEMYELQDHMFLLAKPNKKVIENIKARQSVSKENIENLLQEEYIYNQLKEETSELRNCRNRMKTITNKINKYSNIYGENSSQVAKKRLELERELSIESGILERLESKEEYFKNNKGKVLGSNACKEYVSSNFLRKKEEISGCENLESVLKQQGINLEKWVISNEGLSSGEIQIGINKFLQKYEVADTVFMSNGSYFASHYMDKERLKLNRGKEEVDIPKTIGEKDWTCSLSSIQSQYKARTGKEIKSFDALTKCLCMAKIVSDEINVPFSNVSKRYLEEQAKLDAVKDRSGDYKEGDYVITLSQLENCSIKLDIPRYNADLPTFNSLEYIDFGSERRYVDIDKMFEVNDNFEITLEGEKEPIKNWKELEEKIKALNGQVSPELLNLIQEKYEELSKFVREQEVDFSIKPKKEEGLVCGPTSDLEKRLASLLKKNEELESCFVKRTDLNAKFEQKKKEIIDKVCSDLESLDPLFNSLNLKNVSIFDKSYQSLLASYLKTNSTKYRLFIYDATYDIALKEFSKNWEDIYANLMVDLERKLDETLESVSVEIKSTEELIEELGRD